MTTKIRISGGVAKALMAATMLSGVQAAPAFASSHKEAPLIAGEPRLDSTDFYMFRSYQPNHDGYVTLIANYNPLQDPFGGPNYYQLDPSAFYDINIDNVGDGHEHITFRFRFTNTIEHQTLTIGRRPVQIPLITSGPVGANGSTDNSALNVREAYSVSIIRNNNGNYTSASLADARSGATTFTKPVDNIGARVTPDYKAYAANFVYKVKIPGCGTGQVFVGQRKDPFVVALGQTFDLVNYPHPVGEQFNKSGKDDLVDKNVTSLILEVPAACLTSAGDPVIGAWTSASRVVGQGDNIRVQQVSRLANPLVNELLIGLASKDGWNASIPWQYDSTRFLTYITNPTVPAVVAAVNPGVVAPTKFPRNDLVAIFLTGIKAGTTNINQPKNLTRLAEEMRLNTAVPVTPKGHQSRLGIIGGDLAGYPNGRRPGDDVVGITLRAAMGKLYTLGLYGTPADAPSGGLEFTDGAYIDDSFFPAAFPYLNLPLPGSPDPQPHN